MVNEILQNSYGYLFEPQLLKEIDALGMYRKVNQGEQLIAIGQPITMMPLLLSGVIKILREDENGDELLLYFLETGDSCTMTFSCCLGKSKSKIRAVAEQDTELLMIPVQNMETWMGKYKTWQQFILGSYHTRIEELLETVDALAFMNMDERLLKYLRDKAKVNRDEVINVTHKEIAEDMHTSRVVVSRLLKKLENAGKIVMGRNQVTVVDL